MTTTLTPQERLNLISVELDNALAKYRQTKNDDDLIKANELRVAYARLDVEINGGKR